MADRIRVLIVDDEAAICRAVSMALTRAGFAASTSLSGRGAQEQLSREHFDVLVLDLRMPDMRGDVLFHLATAIQPHLRGRTIFCTGDITERADAIVESCGCPVVRKPFELHEIIDLIRALVPAENRSSA
jgi:DNA-binding NtrC family response regulator